MCGNSLVLSATALTSKNTAPGIWPCGYSGGTSGWPTGGSQALTTTTSGEAILSASHWVETSGESAILESLA